MKELLLLLVLLFSACSDGPEPDTLNIKEDFKCSKDGVNAPEWVCGNVEHEDVEVAVGKAEYSKIGKSFTHKEATANGVAQVKKESQLYVKKKIRTFARMMDSELGQMADDIMQGMSKEIANLDKNDYKQIKEWQNPKNNDFFVLIAIQDKWLNREIKERLLIVYKSDSKIWKKFQELDGEDKLNDLFD